MRHTDPKPNATNQIETFLSLNKLLFHWMAEQSLFSTTDFIIGLYATRMCALTV